MHTARYLAKLGIYAARFTLFLLFKLPLNAAVNICVCQTSELYVELLKRHTCPRHSSNTIHHRYLIVINALLRGNYGSGAARRLYGRSIRLDRR